MSWSSDVIQTLVTFLVGGGLVTLIAQVVRGVSALRTGARASTRAVILDLAAARDDADNRAITYQRDSEFWRNTCAAYSFQMRTAGLTPDPTNPVPPSEQVGLVHRRRDRRQ